MPSEEFILDVRNLRVRYGPRDAGVEAVRDISFTLTRGNTLALVGASGAGKSAAAYSILRLLEPAGHIEAGEILFNSSSAPAVNIAALPGNDPLLYKLRGGKIGMVFQEPLSALSPIHTIGDHILESIRVHRTLHKRDAKTIAHDMLAKVGFSDPEKRMRQYPFELSGGMRQRAVIAMALVCRPELLIADEPTTALDVTVQAQILDLLKSLKKDLGLSILFITHDFNVVGKIADDIAVMHEGKIIETGPARNIFESPTHPITRELLLATPKFTPASTSAAILPQKDLILQVKGLTKHFDLRRKRLFTSSHEIIKAVDNISFDLFRGEALGIVGESGSGKTTAVRCILRALKPTAGSVLFTNNSRTVDLAAASSASLKPLRREMQMVFQDPFTSLNPRMSVGELIAEPLIIHGLGSRKERVDRVVEMLEQVGLKTEHLSRFPTAFSAGQRQRIAIARALILRPALVVADEAVSSLDAMVQGQILNLLRDLQRQLQLTYIVVAHNLAVVRAFCNRVAVMHQGKIVEIGTAEQVLSQPQHPYTQTLLSAVLSPNGNTWTRSASFASASTEPIRP